MYILKSSLDGTYYTGQTNNLKNRITKHNKGQIKSTKSKAPYKLCYFEEFENRSEAMWKEWELKKKWNTERRNKLVSSFDKTKLEEFMGL